MTKFIEVDPCYHKFWLFIKETYIMYVTECDKNQIIEVNLNRYMTKFIEVDPCYHKFWLFIKETYI